MVQAVTGIAYRVPNTLLSDTEESVLGTEWHQEAIEVLAGGLRVVNEDRGSPWGVCSQISLQGLFHEDGTPYDPKPDVMVLAQPLPPGRIAAVHVSLVGAPLFIAEVASGSTYRNDQHDKQQAYAAMGVREYMVLDMEGGLLRTPVMAWRLQGERYVPWRPGPDGWWHSTALDVSLRPAPPFVHIRDRTGIVIPAWSEAWRRAQESERAHAEETRRRVEAEQARMEAEQARIAAEQARVDEVRRRLDLEEQIRRLQEELDRRE